MKEQTKKEREVYAIGRPSLENLTPNERKAFFSTLLMCVIDHFKEDNISGNIGNETPDLQIDTQLNGKIKAHHQGVLKK